MSFKLTIKIHIIIFAVSMAIIALFYNYIIDTLVNFMIQPFINYPFKNMIINFYMYYFLLGFFIAFIHELIHGTAYRKFGGRVKYGFKLIFAYTMEVSGKTITRNEFIIVLLSPVVFISLFSLFLPSWLGSMIFVINFLGSLGDIYMAVYLCKIRTNAKIIDRPYGFDIV